MKLTLLASLMSKDYWKYYIFRSNAPTYNKKEIIKFLTYSIIYVP